ncbi:MAG: ATP-grasp domain-containing protein, partial [Atopobiaceae bacterium]|nr:ATP-grasp domain-containing protein [Atopobiaceae bacterium]
MRTVVCDGRAGAPAKAEADAAFDIAVTNIDEVAALCASQKVDGIVTGFSDLLLECATLIADKAGLPFYLSPQQLPYYRDKDRMKQMFAELGIGSPRHVVLGEGFDDKELASVRFPVVAKPLDMYGSRGVCVLYGPDEVRAAFDKVCETSDDKRILVEEYNQGFEFNLMAWVRGGQVRILGIADREKTARTRGEIPYSCRNVYPSRLQAQIEADALDILQKVVAYTGQVDGELSMQFFWAPGERIEVCEVAARFLGYEHELITYAGGMPIEELLLDSVCDDAAIDGLLERFDARLPRCSAVLYFHGMDGKVASQEQLRSIADIEGIQDLWMFYHDGEEVRPFAQPYFARCT